MLQEMNNRKILLVFIVGLAYELLASTNSVEFIGRQLDDIICPCIHVEGVPAIDMIDFIKDVLTDYDAKPYSCCLPLHQLTNQVSKIETKTPYDRRRDLLKDYPLVYMTTNFVPVKTVLDNLKTCGVTYEITPTEIIFKNKNGEVIDQFSHDQKRAQPVGVPNATMRR